MIIVRKSEVANSAREIIMYRLAVRLKLVKDSTDFSRPKFM